MYRRGALKKQKPIRASSRICVVVGMPRCASQSDHKNARGALRRVPARVYLRIDRERAANSRLSIFMGQDNVPLLSGGGLASSVLLTRSSNFILHRRTIWRPRWRTVQWVVGGRRVAGLFRAMLPWVWITIDKDSDWCGGWRVLVSMMWMAARTGLSRGRDQIGGRRRSTCMDAVRCGHMQDEQAFLSRNDDVLIRWGPMLDILRRGQAPPANKRSDGFLRTVGPGRRATSSWCPVFRRAWSIQAAT